MMGRLTGWYQRWNTTLIEKMGPSQIGAGHAEGVDDRTVDRSCPICHKALSRHTVIRPEGQVRSSTLVCPRD
jgi:hypothetical protein